jgi:hypothetical protein
MSDNPNTHSGTTAPVTITLTPGAFIEGLAGIPPKKIGWTGEDHISLVEFLLEHLTDAEGNKIELDDNSKDRIRLVYRPTEEVQRRVLLQAFTDAGYELDPSATKALVPLISLGQFGKWLSEAVKPGSTDTYIKLEKKRGAKKGMFDALVSTPEPAGAAPVGDTAGTADADYQEEAPPTADEQNPEVVATVKSAPKVPAKK